MAAPCAGCGAAGVKLRACKGCNILRYCDNDCQRAAWKAHKPSCRAGAALQALLNRREVVGDADALRTALAPYADAPPSLAPFAQARLMLARSLLAEKEAALSGTPAFDAFAAAFGILARCPAVLDEDVSVGDTTVRLFDIIVDSGLVNWVLACCRYCLAAARACRPRTLPRSTLAVLRAIAFSDEQPAFAQFFTCWAVACSAQYGDPDDPEPPVFHLPPAGGDDPEPGSLMFEMGSGPSPSFVERARAHERMEALGPAARAQMPANLKGHVDAAVAETKAFNDSLRAAGGVEKIKVVITGADGGQSVVSC